MTPEEYLEQRVEDQILWYEAKSQAAQTSFKGLRRCAIVMAAVIPALAGFAHLCRIIPILIGLLGALVVIFHAFESLGQYHENWLQYRTTCEALKNEKYLFLAKSRPYDTESRLALFVERVEGLISNENSVWRQHARNAGEASESPDGSAADSL